MWEKLTGVQWAKQGACRNSPSISSKSCIFTLPPLLIYHRDVCWALPCSHAPYVLDCWTVTHSLSAQNWNFGQWEMHFLDFFELFNTKYSKILLWVSQAERSELVHMLLLLLFPPAKWESVSLTQRGIIERNQCDKSELITTFRQSEQSLNTLQVKQWALSNRKRTCWLAVHELSAIQDVQWARSMS